MTTTSEFDPSQDHAPRLDKIGIAAILALGFAQGIGYVALSKWITHEWRETHPWLELLLAVSITILPLTAQWLMPHRRRSFFWIMLGLIAALVAFTSWHTMHVALPKHDSSGILQWYIASGFFAWLAIMTLGEFAATTTRRAEDYARLYAIAARNVLLPLSAALFTLLTLGLMWIWSSLFKLLGFTKIANWLLNSHLIYPLEGLAFALATVILLLRPNLIDGTRRVIGAVGSALIPLAALIIIAFIGGTAVAGLKPLWDTGYATHLILLLAAVFTLFLNVTHDDGRNLLCQPRPLLVLTRLGAALLPALVAIAAYSFGLRVAQYGWTPERLYGALALLVAAIVAVGYFLAALRPRAALPSLAKPNMFALVMLALLGIVSNTPLLSPLNIAADNQTARILDGRLPPERISWYGFATGMGQPGRDALERLAATDSLPANVREGARTALNTPVNQLYMLAAPPRPQHNYVVLPKGDAPDPKLLESLRQDPPTASSCKPDCMVLAIDLNGDGIDEMVLLTNAGGQPIYRLGEKGWQRIGTVNNLAGDAKNFDQMIEKLRAGKVRTVAPAYKDIEIDGVAKKVTVYIP